MRSRGFTFIEVILVIVIAAVAIPVALSVVSFMVRGQLLPIGTTIAATLAREELESVIARKRSTCGNCGYANIPVGAGSFTAVSGFPNYQRKTDVVLVDATMVPSVSEIGFKKVTVTVKPIGVGPDIPDAVAVTVLANY